MIKKHIINIGLPRCGTTWLWRHISRLLNYHEPVKENFILHDTANINEYRRYYQNCTVSFNFNPNLYILDRDLIKKLDLVATQVSIILRNPYDQLQSYKNLVGGAPNQNFVDWSSEQGITRYADIINRWQQNLSKPIKIFLFDDLIENPKLFLENYLRFCDVEFMIDDQFDYAKPINKSQSNHAIMFDKDQISRINQEINNLQNIINRNLAHWIQ